MQKYINKKDYLPLVLLVLMIASYFLPWLSGSGHIDKTWLGETYHYHTESSINGFGRGRVDSWADSTHSSASLIWEYGWLNIVGLVLMLIGAIICVLPLLNVELGSLGTKKDLVALFFTALVLILGFVYVGLFFSGAGDIEMRYGEVAVLPLSQYLENAKTYLNLTYSIDYGFILFVILSIAQIVLLLKKK